MRPPSRAIPTGDTAVDEQVRALSILEEVESGLDNSGFNVDSRDYRQDMEFLDSLIRRLTEPIPMLLWCPHCGHQHVDGPDDPDSGWTNPPHRTHQCHLCGWRWRFCDLPTTGVAVIKTAGQDDKSPVPPVVLDGKIRPVEEIEQFIAPEDEDVVFLVSHKRKGTEEIVEVMRLTADGKVEINEDYTPQEAARAFWQQFAQSYLVSMTYALKLERDKLRQQLKELETTTGKGEHPMQTIVTYADRTATLTEDGDAFFADTYEGRLAHNIDKHGNLILQSDGETVAVYRTFEKVVWKETAAKEQHAA